MSRTSVPERPNRLNLVILSVVLAATAAAAAWLWTRPPALPGLDEGRAVAEAFLQELREGRPDQAWKSTTAEFKSAQGQESFQREVQPIEYLKGPLEFVSVQTVMVHNQRRSEYLFRAKTGESVRIVLGREEGGWKVDRWTRS